MHDSGENASKQGSSVGRVLGAGLNGLNNLVLYCWLVHGFQKECGGKVTAGRSLEGDYKRRWLEVVFGTSPTWQSLSRDGTFEFDLRKAPGSSGTEAGRFAESHGGR